MDINIKIIEGVTRFPSLMDNNGSLHERDQCWINLAEKLRMPAQILKIRWHSLLQGYQRDENFKYANYMHFVYRNPETESKIENWPEFIITEEDLKEENQESQEEFVFLEAEEDDSKKSFTQESSKEKEFNINNISKQMVEIPNKAFKSDGQDKANAKKAIAEVDISSEPYRSHDEEVVEINAHESKERDVNTVATSNVEEQMAAIHVNINNGSCIEESKEVSVVKPQPLIAERCEDVIFGELVSAMLKRMDENKKKNIKREIMNLLFS